MEYAKSFFDVVTGEIIGACYLGNDPFRIDNYPDGYWSGDLGEIDELINSNTEYIDIDVVQKIARPNMPTSISPSDLVIVADGGEVAVISGIPIGTKVVLVRDDINIEYVVNDNLFEFSSDTPKKETVKLQNFPYKPKRYVINAT